MTPSTTVKERPIIFDAESIRGILAGTKSQTRRVVKPQPKHAHTGFLMMNSGECIECGPDYPDCDEDIRRCPFGAPGDRLWVRETAWIDRRRLDGTRLRCFRDDGTMQFEDGEQGVSTGREPWTQWTPEQRRIDYNLNKSLKLTRPIHLPRWASRITLEVASVRVERVQEISEADARAEGIADDYDDWREEVSDIAPPGSSFETRRDWFARRWDAINAKRGHPWSSNPWVWAVEFRRLTDA